MKTTIAAFLLPFLLIPASSLAQADEPYIVPHRGAMLAHPASKRIGWNNSGTGWQETGIDRADKLTRMGNMALENGNTSNAEVDFRDAINQEERFGTAYAGLAKVLAIQGKTREAIVAYRKLFYDLPLRSIDEPEKEKYRQQTYKDPVGASQYVADGLRYALLLNRTGQWSEAMTVYDSALQGVPGGDLPKLNLPFDASDFQPVAFEAMAHLALGLTMTFGVEPEKNQKAMSEYMAASRLEPDWVLTNYYYGYGWKRLDLQSKTRLMDAPQAKAALQKAALADDPAVKKAASEALRGWR